MPVIYWIPGAAGPEVDLTFMRLHAISRGCPPSITISAVIRTLFDAWPTSRFRGGAHARRLRCCNMG
eukprot:2468996-Pyramimonas_sp.AAC.1